MSGLKIGMDFRGQWPVVQMVNSAIHRINHFPADNTIVSYKFIRWIVIYPLDSAILCLNNRGQV